jgi:hypothetical protein
MKKMIPKNRLISGIGYPFKKIVYARKTGDANRFWVQLEVGLKIPALDGM